MPVINGNFGNVFLQRSQIGFLADRLVRVEPSGHTGRKIFNGKDLVCGIEKLREKCFDIEPLVRGIPDSAVIKIESVDVNVGSHGVGHKKAGAA